MEYVGIQWDIMCDIFDQECDIIWDMSVSENANTTKLRFLAGILMIFYLKNWQSFFGVISGYPLFSDKPQNRDTSVSSILQKNYTHYAAWWFGTWILFSPIVGMMIQSDELIFSDGWVNHQAGYAVSEYVSNKIPKANRSSCSRFEIPSVKRFFGSSQQAWGWERLDNTLRSESHWIQHWCLSQWIGGLTSRLLGEMFVSKYNIHI